MPFRFTLERLKYWRMRNVKRLLFLGILIASCVAGKPKISGFDSMSSNDFFGNGSDGDFTVSGVDINSTATVGGHKIMSNVRITGVTPDKMTLTLASTPVTNQGVDFSAHRSCALFLRQRV